MNVPELMKGLDEVLAHLRPLAAGPPLTTEELKLMEARAAVYDAINSVERAVAALRKVPPSSPR